MKFLVSPMTVLFMGAALGAVGGCSSVENHYYSLAPLPGTIVDQSSIRPLGSVKVYIASIPSRLDRDTIVEGDRNYRLKLVDASSWSEPLGEMISQTLVSDLSQRLPGRVIIAQNQSVALEPSVFVDLAIQNFERNADNHVVIKGVISIKEKGSGQNPQDKSFSEIFNWVSPQAVPENTEAFVASLSQGVSAIADHVALSLR